MTNDGMPADLGASDRGHEVQYYEHSRFLVSRVADFVVPGLQAGEAAAVIAIPKHADLITAAHDERLIRMNGHDTFKHAVARMSEATRRVLAEAELELADVDLFVYHQANSRIIRAVGEELGLPARRTADYVGRFGNTSAATLPIALAMAEEEGRLLGDGEIVLLAAFGAGLTWGATTIQWGTGR